MAIYFDLMLISCLFIYIMFLCSTINHRLVNDLWSMNSSHWPLKIPLFYRRVFGKMPKSHARYIVTLSLVKIVYFGIVTAHVLKGHEPYYITILFNIHITIYYFFANSMFAGQTFHLLHVMLNAPILGSLES